MISDTEFPFDYIVINSAPYKRWIQRISRINRARREAASPEAWVDVEVPGKELPQSLPVRTTSLTKQPYASSSREQHSRHDSANFQGFYVAPYKNLEEPEVISSDADSVSSLSFPQDTPYEEGVYSGYQMGLGTIVEMLTYRRTVRISPLADKLGELSQVPFNDLVEWPHLIFDQEKIMEKYYTDADLSYVDESDDDDDFDDFAAGLVGGLVKKAAEHARNGSLAGSVASLQNALSRADESTWSQELKVSRMHILVLLAITYGRHDCFDDFDETLQKMSPGNERILYSLQRLVITKLVINAIQSQHEMEAERALRIAVKRIEQLQHHQDPLLNKEHISLELAYCCFVQKKFEEVESILQETPSKDCFRRESLMAVVRYSQQKLDESETLLRKSIKFRRKVLASGSKMYEDEHVRSCIRILASIYRSRGEPEVADSCLDLIKPSGRRTESMSQLPCPVIAEDLSPVELASPFHDVGRRSSQGTQPTILNNHDAEVWALAFSPDGTLLATGARKGSLMLIDCQTKQLRHKLQGHGSAVRSVAFSPDSRFVASGSYDCSIRVWLTGSGAAYRTLRGHRSEIMAVAISANGKLLASGSLDAKVQLWDLASGNLVNTLTGHDDVVLSLAFSPNGRVLASGSSDRTVRIWDLHTNGLRFELQGHPTRIWAVQFTPDSVWLLSASRDGEVKSWSSAGALCSTLRGQFDVDKLNLAFSPDGRLVAASSAALNDRNVTIRDATNGQVRCVLQRSSEMDAVGSIAISPDGRFVAVGSDDGTVELWNLYAQGFVEGHDQLQTPMPLPLSPSRPSSILARWNHADESVDGWGSHFSQ